MRAAPGGGPLLVPGFKELYLALKAEGMVLTLNTNGTLLDEPWADFFAHPMAPAGEHHPLRGR